MARIKIRKIGPSRWQVTRPKFGFAIGDKVTEHRTQPDAIRSLPGRRAGTPAIVAEISGHAADGIAPISPWTPLWDTPGPHGT